MTTLIGGIQARVILPVLDALALPGDPVARRQLMAGIGNVETGYRTRRQANGPALGYWQVEPRTHDDLWRNWLGNRLTLAHIARGYLPSQYSASPIGHASAMVLSDSYGLCIAALVFFRSDEPLPARDDPVAQCRAWKRAYNTAAGAGAVDPSHIAAFQAAISA
mgnify:CR=1 FL=1